MRDPGNEVARGTNKSPYHMVRSVSGGQCELNQILRSDSLPELANCTISRLLGIAVSRKKYFCSVKMARF